jgi:predicted SAM-dependent methyltransferase
MRFFLFGQRIGLRCLVKFKYNNFKTFLLNPIVLFRYPEFAFAYHSSNWEGMKVLDISSPNLFSAYLCEKHKNIHVSMYNPDVRDISQTQILYTEMEIPRQKVAFFTSLPERENCFDIVVSNSVIEHVVEDEIADYLQNIWSMLRLNGTFVLTFPVAKKHRKEYRDFNSYGLDVPRNGDGKYFFQRVYDDETIEEKIVAIWRRVGGGFVNKEIYGLKEGFNFREYTKRLLRYGPIETRNDVYNYKRYIRHYCYTTNLPDRGICGLVLSKGGSSGG